MNKTFDLVSVFRLNGYNVSSVTHGNQVVLKILQSCAPDVALKGLFDSIIRLTNLATNICKSGARLIGNHILRENRTRDSSLKLTHGHQPLKKLVKSGLKASVGA